MDSREAEVDSMTTKADSMGRARPTVFVLVLLIALFPQLASNGAAVAAPGKPQNTGPSNKPIYVVTCQGGSLDSPGVRATPQAALT